MKTLKLSGTKKVINTKEVWVIVLTDNLVQNETQVFETKESAEECFINAIKRCDLEMTEEDIQDCLDDWIYEDNGSLTVTINSVPLQK